VCDILANPIEIAKEKIIGMTDAQRNVADYIIKNSLEVAFMTIEQLSRRVGTSTTTIMRLMTYLGYTGYAEFQKELRGLLREKLNPKKKLEINLKEIDDSNIWTKCYEKQKENMVNTFSMISVDKLDETVERIINARKIYFASARGGRSVSQYLMSFFSRMIGNCYLIHTDMFTDWIDLLYDMNNQDLIIAISYPRYASSMVNLLRLAKNNDVQIISITDSYSSPLNEFSSFILPCSCDSLGFHNSPITAMIIADCLINAIAVKYASKIEKRLDKADSIATELNYYDL